MKHEICQFQHDVIMQWFHQSRVHFSNVSHLFQKSDSRSQMGRIGRTSDMVVNSKFTEPLCYKPFRGWRGSCVFSLTGGWWKWRGWKGGKMARSCDLCLKRHTCWTTGRRLGSHRPGEPQCTSVWLPCGSACILHICEFFFVFLTGGKLVVVGLEHWGTLWLCSVLYWLIHSSWDQWHVNVRFTMEMSYCEIHRLVLRLWWTVSETIHSITFFIVISNQFGLCKSVVWWVWLIRISVFQLRTSANTSD